MKYAIIIISAIAVALLSAAAARYFTTESLRSGDDIYADFQLTQSGWLYSDTIGAARASAAQRAKVAMSGPLGLSAREAVYFVAVTDSQGRTLSSKCNYRVTGSPLDTRWWSLALYDSQTQHYVKNSVNRSSWNSVAISREDNRDWTVTVSPSPKGTNWLPSQTGESQPFELILRVYNPSDAARAALPNINLPVVERASC